MSADYTAAVVAAISVVGTLGGTLLTQQISLRSKRLEIEARKMEADLSQQAAAQERAEDRQHERLAEQTALYAELNSAARIYRSSCHDYATSLARLGTNSPSREQSLLAALQEARSTYRDLYARAQMILADQTLAVVSVANLCLGFADGAVRECSDAIDSLPEPTTEQRTALTMHVREWLAGPATDAEWLLRQTLREELGAAEPFAKRADYLQAITMAYIARYEGIPASYREFRAQLTAYEPDTGRDY